MPRNRSSRTETFCHFVRSCEILPIEAIGRQPQNSGQFDAVGKFRLMARRFVVHVGAPKTGTSAFQEWAVANRVALRESGFHYPAIGATAGGNHAALVSALSGAIDDSPRRTHLTRLFERDLEAHPDATVILSGEMMTTLRFLPYMAGLRRALASFGGDATVVLCVRDQISWRNSCYAQTREMMTPLPPFRDYIAIGKNGPRGGNWDFLERKYRKAGFDFEPLAFDRRVRDIGIVAAIGSLPCLAGLTSAADAERREANPSVGDLALLVAEEVRNAIAGPGGELPVGLRPKLMPIITRHAARLPVTSFNGFDLPLADEIRAAYLPSNNAFAQRHFGCDWQTLFPPSTPGHVSHDDIDELAPRDRRRVRDVAGRALMEAIDAGILQLTPR